MKKKNAIPLPQTLKLHPLTGPEFIEVKSAAKLSGIHPDVLQMALNLLKRPDGQGASFLLQTKELVAAADAIEEAMRTGMKKVAKAMGQSVNVKRYRDDKKLVFWYETRVPHMKGAV